MLFVLTYKAAGTDCLTTRAATSVRRSAWMHLKAFHIKAVLSHYIAARRCRVTRA
jgi:hypothetical protein